MLKIKKIQDYLPYLLLPLALVILIEIIYTGSLPQFYTWADKFSREFLTGYLVAFALLNIFAAFPKKIYFNIVNIIFIAALVFSIVNRVKINFKGEPLLPWDLTLRNEALNISEYFNLIADKGLGIFIVILFLLAEIYLIKFILKRNSKQSCIVLPVLAAILLLSMYTDKPYRLDKDLGMTIITWDQEAHYSQNGFLLGFFLNSKMYAVAKPADYTAAKISGIRDKIEPLNDLDTALQPDNKKPNIIMIMSEAFWDPTVMKNISFNKDPLPFFRKMQERFTSGNLVVPVFGGGTVNTEFEVLTGFSTKFIRSGAIIYSQYINKPIDSLARILADEGYASTAIHPYHNWFYKRNEVYRYMGFDRFISAEAMLEPEYKGQFISDGEVTKMITDEVKRTKGRDFIFAVTMQNHGPYDISEPDNLIDKGKDRITVGGDLSDEAKSLLEYYAQGIYYSDKALKELITYFAKSKEPTLVLFFGDHLPLLGENRLVYEEANYFDEIEPYEGYLRNYSVPFMIWDNFLEKREQNITLSANFMPAFIMDLAELNKTPFLNYAGYVYEHGLKVIPSKKYYQNLAINEESINDYMDLQYDLMFGQQYINNNISLAVKDYHLGLEEFTVSDIDRIDKKAGKSENLADEEATLEVSGKGFTKNSVVYINDEPADTSWINSGSLSVTVPKSLFDSSGVLEVQVKLIDSLNRIMTESKKLIFDEQ